MASRDTLLIEPGRSEVNYWADLWSYRELLYFLAWRDLLVRYKQTALGVAWAVLRPLVTVAILTVVFGALAKLPSEGVPYALLVFAGTLPWLLFANALNDIGGSLLSNAGMISKVYFPRLVVPLGAVAVNLADFAVAAVAVALVMAWYGFAPDWRLVALPAFLLLAVCAVLGLGLLVAALNVRYRDFRHLLPFIVQFGLFISPVGYSSSIIPEAWRLLYYLNPMAGVIDGFRWTLLAGHFTPYWPGLVASTVVTMFLLWSGVAYFRATEKTFADVI
jgi:lipopolysaccharide transport system permease protein